MNPSPLQPLVSALTQALWEAKLLLRDRLGRLRARRYAGQRGLQLHIGCGPNRKTGWVNIDAVRGADLRLDLRQRLPFADGSCALVYSEHFFEHLDYPDTARRHLHECHRVLQHGGRLSLGVPDAELMIRGYAPETPGVTDAPPVAGHPDWARTWMERINFFFRQNYRVDFAEHRMAYDFETLEKNLRLAGFVRIARRDFDPALDHPTRRDGTLYVDAFRD
jgi:predicted SAM-dependent methyltransferase